MAIFTKPIKNYSAAALTDFPFKKLVTLKKISPSEGCLKGISHFQLLDHFLHNFPRLEEKNASAKLNCI
jgi:hypothetical protein